MRPDGTQRRVPRPPSGSTQESGGLQLGRDLLHGLLDVRGLAGARADELAAAEEEDDDLRHVDPVDEPGELLRLVLDLPQPEGDRDRVQVGLRAEVRRGDDILDHDLRCLVDRDARGLDLLPNEVDGDLHALEALRARANDLAAAKKEDRGLRLLQAVDESRELLRLVPGPAEGEGDRLEIERFPEGSRGDDVLNPDLDQGTSSAGRRRLPRRNRLGRDLSGALYSWVSHAGLPRRETLSPAAGRRARRGGGGTGGAGPWTG